MNRDEWKKTLQMMSDEELLDLLMEYAEEDQSFARTFLEQVENKLKRGGEAEAREEVSLSFCREHPMAGRYNCCDGIDWYAIMNDCSVLFQKAEQALSMGNVRRAVAYPLQWLSDFSASFTESAFEYDDEGTEFGCACEEALKIIEQGMLHPQADACFKEEVSEELSAIADQANVFDDYCFVNLKLFARRMAAMIQSPEDALSTVESLLETNEDGARLSTLILQKGTILMAMGRTEEALQFWEINCCEEEVCKHLVDYLMEQKNSERALKVLEKAIRQGEPYESRKWLRKELAIYEALGQTAQVIAAHRRLFIALGGEWTSYEALKSLIPADEWKGYLAALMNETDFSDYCWFGEGNTKANILLSEEDLDGLFDYLMQVESDFALELYGYYAKRLPAAKQCELLPNYSYEIRQEASKARKRDHYARVCSHISALKELEGADGTVTDLLVEFRDVYGHRPAFMDELRKLDGE